jgi:hypothetical protein
MLCWPHEPGEPDREAGRETARFRWATLPMSGHLGACGSESRTALVRALNRTPDPLHAIDAPVVRNALRRPTSPRNRAGKERPPRVGWWGDARLRVAQFLANLWHARVVVHMWLYTCVRVHLALNEPAHRSTVGATKKWRGPDLRVEPVAADRYEAAGSRRGWPPVSRRTSVTEGATSARRVAGSSAGVRSR